MNKKLSIITINYNNLTGLQKTVESVTTQSWQEFEYIVIDGGSTDGSVAYLKSRTDKITYWVSEPDKGIYNAMNKGIVKATGEYLLFLNSGDHFHTQNILAENHHNMKFFDLIYFDLQIVSQHEYFIKKYPALLSFSYLFRNSLPHPATFIKREAFEKTSLYSEEFKIVADWKFFIVGICKFNLTYTKINAILSTFYADGISSVAENRELILIEREQVLKEEFLVFIDEAIELDYLKTVVRNLRKSRKINWLIKLGMLDRF